MASPTPSREDVLRAFAFEPEHGPDVLKRYLAAFPHLAPDLVDLSLELAREIDEDVPLSQHDLSSIQESVGRYKAGAPVFTDVSAIPASAYSSAADKLSLPLQVLVAFRDRRVELASIPARFLRSLAQALQTTKGALESFLALPPLAAPARARKSDVRPPPPSKVPFERLLVDAGVAQRRVNELLGLDS